MGGRILTPFVDTIIMMGKRKVAAIAGWNEAASHIEEWAMFCNVFLGNNGVNPVTYDMFLLAEETSRVSPQLRTQAFQQPTFPTSLIFLIQ